MDLTPDDQDEDVIADDEDVDITTPLHGHEVVVQDEEVMPDEEVAPDDTPLLTPYEKKKKAIEDSIKKSDHKKKKINVTYY